MNHRRGTHTPDDQRQRCTACEQAMRTPLSGAYAAGCTECAARHLAHSPMYWAASVADALTPSYRHALRAAFGVQWMDGHALVKRWAERIEAAHIAAENVASVPWSWCE